jgi:hypothetical protein
MAAREKPTFLDQVMQTERREGRHTNNNYQNLRDIKKESMSISVHGHYHKDEFKKAQRLTIPAEIE